MSARNYRLFLLAGLVSAAAAGATGCEITKVDCDKTPDEDICQDHPEDGGDDLPDEEDAGKTDAGKTDAGKTDAGADGGKTDGGKTDGGNGSDGSAEASTDAATAPLTIETFCIAQLTSAVAWRDALGDLCGSSTSLAAREKFLLEVLAYDAVNDAEGKCITARKANIDSGNTTFDGTKAQACADAFTKSFALPPDPFPADGIDVAKYRSTIAHGAPALVQIPACRAAFKGKLTRGKPCMDHFECIEGQRCLDAPGGTKTCEPAVSGGTCTLSSQCSDGYTCVGSTSGGGKTCVKSDALPLNGGNCSFALECGENLDCNSSGKCANPVAEVICKP